MWYKYLDSLCERGLLTTELREMQESKKRVTYYLVPKKTSFNLPKYEDLANFSVINNNCNGGIDAQNSDSQRENGEKVGTIVTIETINMQKSKRKGQKEAWGDTNKDFVSNVSNDTIDTIDTNVTIDNNNNNNNNKSKKKR